MEGATANVANAPWLIFNDRRKMIYGYTDMGTNWCEPDWRDKIWDAAFFFIPRSNPEYHALFPKIKKWCLEIDDTGSVNREIALDCDDQPVFHIPDGSENLGFWMDEDRTFSADELLSGIPTGGFDRLDRSDSLPERKKGALGFEAAADFGADFRPRGHSHHSLAWTLRDHLVRSRPMKEADPAASANVRPAAY